MKKIIMCSLDVSTKKTGFAVFSNGKYKTSMLLDHSDNSDVKSRSNEMTQDIIKCLESFQPVIVSIEDTYCGRNADTMKKLCRIQGAIYGWCLLNKSDFNVYLPSSWRKEFGNLFKGKKRNECKTIAIKYVKDNLGIEVNNDEAEAILIGVATVKKYND